MDFVCGRSCSFDKTLAVWSLPKCDRPKPVSSLTLSAFHSGPPVVLVDFENLVFDVAGLQSSSSSSSDPATPVVPAATSPVIPSIMIEPSGDKDDPLPGAVEALREMVQEGLDVYLWLGNDVYVLAQRLQWVRLRAHTRVPSLSQTHRTHDTHATHAHR